MIGECVEKWRHAWRTAVAPLLSTEGLEALRDALANDSAELIQDANCSPPSFSFTDDWPVEAACAVTYCGWKDGTVKTAGDADSYFLRLAFEADMVLGSPGACAAFLNQYDEWHRSVMLAELLPEVERSIRERGTTREPAHHVPG